MPFELQRDDERRLLIVRATGKLSPSEIAHRRQEPARAWLDQV